MARRHRRPRGIDNFGDDARQRQRAASRFRRRAARQRAHHDPAGLRLPPRVDDRAAFAADHLVVPHPSLGIDPFADGAEEAEAREVAAFDVLHSPLHEGADRRRGGVEDRRLLRLDDLPKASFVRGIRGPFVDEEAGAGGEGAVGHVAVAGDPAAVGRAPEEIVVAEIEDPFRRRLRPEDVAGGGVLDPLRLPRRTTRVEDEQRGLGIHRLRRRVGRHPLDEVVPPDVATGSHLHRLPGALQHDDVPHRRALLDGDVDVLLEGELGSAPPAAVGRDHGHGAGVLVAVGDRFAREAAEDHGMNGADAGAGEHRDHELRRHRHVDRHHFARLDAELPQPCRHPANLGVELAVGVFAALAGRLTDPHERRLLPLARGDVPVEAGGRGVETPPHEPLRCRGMPIEDLRVGGRPGEGRGAFRPEALGIALRSVVEAAVVLERADPRPGGKLRRRRKHPLFGHDARDGPGRPLCFAHQCSPDSAEIMRGNSSQKNPESP